LGNRPSSGVSMNDDRSPLRRATLQDTGDCFYIGKARDLMQVAA
jgi:hypothetical protein